MGWFLSASPLSSPTAWLHCWGRSPPSPVRPTEDTSAIPLLLRGLSTLLLLMHQMDWSATGTISAPWSQSSWVGPTRINRSQKCSPDWPTILQPKDMAERNSFHHRRPANYKCTWRSFFPFTLYLTCCFGAPPPWSSPLVTLSDACVCER